MGICFLCGQDYRDVYKSGRIVRLTGEQPHYRVCTGKGPNRPRNRPLREARRRRNKILAAGRRAGTESNKARARERQEFFGTEARRILLHHPNLLKSLPRVAEIVAQSCATNGIKLANGRPCKAGAIYNYLLRNKQAALKEPQKKISISLGA